MRTRPGLLLKCLPMILAAMPMELEAADPRIHITHDFDAQWGYVADATTDGPGPSFDSGEQHSARLRYTLSPQKSTRVLLTFGAEWERFWFSPPRLAPVPATLQGINAVLGAVWQFNDRWLFRGELRPGVYSTFDDVSWRHVDAPLFLGAAYLANPDLQWLLGVRIAMRSEYPVIPAVGVRWKFADDWTLNALFPSPRVEYELSSSVKLHLGADFRGGYFRVGDTFGSDRGAPELDRQILDYFELSVGPGFSWKIRPNITLEATAGYMVLRRFDFADRDIVYRSEPAPSFQIACNFSL